MRHSLQVFPGGDALADRCRSAFSTQLGSIVPFSVSFMASLRGQGGVAGGSGTARCGPGMIQMAGEAVFFPILLVCYVAR